MDQERLDFLAQIAVWYYEERLDQETIAGRINKSRSMVSRLLDQAREAGLVEVKVLYPLRTDAELERRLCDEFGLAHAQVLAEPPDDYRLLLKRLGELGARCLQQALRPGVIIGISWGTAVHSVVSAMPTRRPCRIPPSSSSSARWDMAIPWWTAPSWAAGWRRSCTPRSASCRRRCWWRTRRWRWRCAGSARSKRPWRWPRAPTSR